MSKKCVKEKVNVYVDINEGVTAIVDKKDSTCKKIVPFRGIDGLGSKFFVYGKNESNIIRWDIIEDCFPEFDKLTERKQNELFNKIKKYVDVSVYYALLKYDNDNSYQTSKAEDYVKIVMKSLNKISKKERKSRKKFF